MKVTVEQALIIGLLFLAFIFGVVSCSTSKKQSKVLMSEYTCYTKPLDTNRYSEKDTIFYDVHIILLGKTSFFEKRSYSILNNKNYFGNSNVQFRTKKISKFELKSDTVSYKDLYKKYYLAGEIQLIVVPDHITFEEDINTEGVTYGVANGVPTVENTAKGKPQIVIRQLYTLNAVLSHEMGHVFGLPHTFEGNDMFNKGLNCHSGDKIPDTVTPHELSGVFNQSCELFLPEELKGFYTEEEKKNIVGNGMSYSPYNCMIGFTKEQQGLIRLMATLNPRLQDAESKT